MFILAKARSASVSALDLRRFLATLTPMAEKRRSTVADVAGQPRYCRAITERLGKSSSFSFHH